MDDPAVPGVHRLECDHLALVEALAHPVGANVEDLGLAPGDDLHRIALGERVGVRDVDVGGEPYRPGSDPKKINRTYTGYDLTSGKVVRTIPMYSLP